MQHAVWLINSKNAKSQRGFTFMELVIVIGIILMLMGFIAVNVVRTERVVSVSAAVDGLTADMNSQQTKAMVGSSEDGVISDNYGIYFQSDRYTLFHGLVYSSSDPSNFTVMLDAPLTFSSITFPNNTIVFSRISGEVNNFTNGQNTVTIKNTAGTEQKTITVNRYGVITGIN